MRAALIFVGVLLGALGGVIAYRAYFVEPGDSVVISPEGVRELPNYARVLAGLALTLAGAALAFFSARRRR